MSSSSNPDSGPPSVCVCVCVCVCVSDRCSSHRLASSPSRERRGRGQSSRVASGSFPPPAVEYASTAAGDRHHHHSCVAFDRSALQSKQRPQWPPSHHSFPDVDAMRRSSLLSVTDADYVLLQVNSHQSSPLFLGGGAPAAALGTAKSGVAAMVLQGGWKDVVSSRRDQPINVYAWNLDETLILLKVLLDGSFAGHFEGLKIHEKGTEIGKHWETIVLELCDEHFFYEEIENYNQPYIGALYEYDDGKDLNMILRLTGLVLLMMMLIKGSLDIGSVLSEISMQRQVVIRARNLRNGVQFIPAKAF